MRSTLLLATLALAFAAAPGASPNHDALVARATVTDEDDLVHRRSHGGTPSTSQFVSTLEAKYAAPAQNPNVQGGWSGWTACSKQCGGGTKSHTCNNPTPAKNQIARRRTRSQNNQVTHWTLNADFRKLTCVLADGSTNWKIIGEGTGGATAPPNKMAVLFPAGSNYRTDWCRNMKTGYGSSAFRDASGANPFNCNTPRDMHTSTINGPTESVPCNTHACAVNGGWSTYGSWTACSKKCGGGTKSRTRSCNNPSPAGAGADCGRADTNTIPCNTQSCAVNGGWSTYGSWGSCSKTCGSGTQERTRACNSPYPANGGKGCGGSKTGFQACNTEACAVDCRVAYWGGFSACTKSCGGGSQRRTRVLTQPQHGGKGCPTHYEDRKCGEGGCAVHCTVNAFAAWSACTKSCGKGAQSRSRSVTSKATNGGYVCPYLAETRSCNSASCPVNGQVGDWSDFSACTASCGGGAQKRHRYVTVAPDFGGKAHAHLQETRSCNTFACAIDCVTNGWAAWSTCTKSCGTGSQQRRRTQVEATRGGKSCPHYAETRACNTAGCATDCKVAATFGAWSTCTVSCNGGSQQRTRANVAPSNGGVACPHSAETRTCGMRKCPIDGGWSAFGSCDKFCGSGSQSRTCTNPAPRYGGASCADSATGACNTAVCPKAPACSVLANGETVVHYTDTPSFKCSHTATTCTCSVSGHPTHHKGGCKQLDHTNGKTLSFAGDCTSTGLN